MLSLVYRGQFYFVINLKRLIDGLKQKVLRENDWTRDNFSNNKRLFNVTIDKSKRTNDTTPESS